MKIGLISDIHEDVESLKKTFSILSEKKITEVICLGDIVGFYHEHYNFHDEKDAKECLDLIRKKCNLIILGNHCMYTAKKIPKYSAGINYHENWFELSPEKRRELSNKKLWEYEKHIKHNLDIKDIELLKSFHEYKVRSYDPLNIFFSHFIYPDLSGSTVDYPTKRKQLQPHYNFIKKHNCDISFSGHAHYQGIGIADQNEFKILKFGKHRVNRSTFWISIPSIAGQGHYAHTIRDTGFAIFNTSNYEIEVIQLNN